MGVVKDVVDRLILESPHDRGVLNEEPDRSNYEVRFKQSEEASRIVTQHVMRSVESQGSAGRQPGSVPIVEGISVSSTPDGPRHKAEEAQAIALLDRPSAEKVEPSLPRVHPLATAVVRAKADVRHETHRYAIGGDRLGSAGVAPIEMAGFHPSPGGVQGNLMNAIDEYVQYHQAKHVAGLVRQGILPR